MIHVSSFFDHVYVVNLPRRTDRRCLMEARLRRWRIQAEFLSAIDGSSPSQQNEYAAYLRKPLFSSGSPALEWELGRKLFTSPGAWACNKTFYGLLADARDRGLERILILEDDAVFHKQFDQRFDQVARQLPEDWQVFFLGATQLEWDRPGALIDAEDDRALYYHPVKTNGCFALGLHRNTFAPLLEELLRMECPFDSGPLRTVVQSHPGRCFVAMPNLVVADVSDSDIRDGQSPEKTAAKTRWDLSRYEPPDTGVDPRSTEAPPFPQRSIDALVEREMDPRIRRWMRRERWAVWRRFPALRSWMERRNRNRQERRTTSAG